MLCHLGSGTRTCPDESLPPVRRTQNLQTIPQGRMQIFVYLTVEFIQTVTGKRSGAAEARWAHNPKVGGSKPPFATFCLLQDPTLARTRIRLDKKFPVRDLNPGRPDENRVS